MRLRAAATGGRDPWSSEMVERCRIKLLMGALATILLPGLPSCAWPNYEGSPPRGYPSSYYDYWYYPDQSIYFHIDTGWYYYRDRGRWWRVRRLPPHFHLNQRRRRLLILRDGKPWQRHDEHRRKYPPSPKPRHGLRPEQKPYSPTLRRPPKVRRNGEHDFAPKRAPAPRTPRDRDLRLKRVPSPSVRRERDSQPKPEPPPKHRYDRERDRGRREKNIQPSQKRQKQPLLPPED